MEKRSEIRKQFFLFKLPQKVIITVIVFSAILSTLGISYAYFTISQEKRNILHINVGQFYYTLSGSGISSSGTVEASAQENTVISIDLTSQNQIESDYQLFYYTPLPEDVMIYYQTDTDAPAGTIGKVGSTKKITVMIQNRTTSKKTITLGVSGGLPGKGAVSVANTKPVIEPAKIYMIYAQNSNYGTTTITNQRTGESSTTSLAMYDYDSVKMSFSANSSYQHISTNIRNLQEEFLTTLLPNETTYKVTESIVLHPSWKKEDLTLLQVDSFSLYNWSVTLHEGEVLQDVRYIPDRKYLYFYYANAGSSRYDLVTETQLLINEYQKVTITGISYYAEADCTLTLAATYDRNQWLNYSFPPMTTVVVPMNAWFQYELDVSQKTGNHYIGVQVLSHGKPFSLEVHSVFLTGKTFTP